MIKKYIAGGEIQKGDLCFLKKGKIYPFYPRIGIIVECIKNIVKVRMFPSRLNFPKVKQFIKSKNWKSKTSKATGEQACLSPDGTVLPLRDIGYQK